MLFWGLCISMVTPFKLTFEVELDLALGPAGQAIGAGEGDVDPARDGWMRERGRQFVELQNPVSIHVTENRSRRIDATNDGGRFQELDVVGYERSRIAGSQNEVIVIGVNFIKSLFTATFRESSGNMTKFTDYHGPVHTARSAVSPLDGSQNVAVSWHRDMNTLVKFSADDSDLLWALP